MKVLREESLFSDVTLLCDDVSLVAAHKIVLAAHSDRFEQNLTQEMTESPSPSLQSTEPPVAWLTSYTRARPASAGMRCSRCRAEQNRLEEKGQEPDTHISEEHTELEDRAGGGLKASPLNST